MISQTPQSNTMPVVTITNSFGNSLTPEMLPYLLPGTIISIDNHKKAQRYFFEKPRPLTKVAYILIVGDSDGNTPEGAFAPKIKSDDLLLKYYSANPDMQMVDKHQARDKFVPMSLGLSKMHRQTPFLYNYLKVNNFASPFSDLTRWTSRLAELEDPQKDNLNDVLFVSMTVEDRRSLHDTFCKDRPTSSMLKDNISCTTKSFLPHQTYNASSHYLFGISPPGGGVGLLSHVRNVIDGYDFSH